MAEPRPYQRLPNSIARSAAWLGRTWARLSYARHIEPTWLEINRLTVPISDLAPSFVGLKIAHLSDFHVGHRLPDDYLHHSVDTVLAEKPDLIVLTGDFIHQGYRHIDRVAQALSRLRAELGVYAVLGNHDFSVRNRLGFRRHRGLHLAITEALTSVSVQVLRNQAIRLQRGEDSLMLLGLDDLWSGECNPSAAFVAHFDLIPHLILAHNPWTIDVLAPGQRCDLMLSGHTHGGQIDWPGLGRVMLLGKSGRLAAGLYDTPGGSLYVNKGVGFGLRFRFQVRPEVAILTLVPTDTTVQTLDGTVPPPANC